MLAGVLPASRHFARAIVMPNLVPPVVTAADARAYRERILAALPAGQDFTPLMTLYLTEATDPERRGRAPPPRGWSRRSSSTRRGDDQLARAGCATSRG